MPGPAGCCRAGQLLTAGCSRLLLQRLGPLPPLTPLATHVVPLQGSLTTSATRLFAWVSFVLPYEHLL